MTKIYCLILLIIFTSCKDKNTINGESDRKIVDNKFSVLIPSSMTKTSGLNPYTTFEYQNTQDDFYVIVMDESSDGFSKTVNQKIYDVTPDIKGYYNVILDHFREETNLKDFRVFDEIFELDKPEKKITFTMTGIDVTDDYPVYYRYSIIESKTTYYQIMSWTNQTNAEKIIPEMNKIINSFKIEEK
ncbi:hypothetical protein [Xanthomarina sp. GH4-25]|uniref:hypothetical protein n=1 Tax=Xanthomarina sp. GH4-25 TaxID=3349335 RepID=UPI003877F838